MSPKTHRAKSFSGKEDRPPVFSRVGMKCPPPYCQIHNMKQTYKNFIFYWAPVISYCVFIFIQSEFPSAIKTHDIPHIDKLAHFLGYGLLGILFFRAFRTTSLKENADRLMLFSMAASILYGISDEIHQYYVPFRSADIADALADMLGSIYGVFFYQIIVERVLNPFYLEQIIVERPQVKKINPFYLGQYRIIKYADNAVVNAVLTKFRNFYKNRH